MLEIGTKVRIVLKEVKDSIDQSIQGKEGTVASVSADHYNSFDYCVLIGNVKFGLMVNEIEVITDE